jgi:hypothetical protein
MPHAASCSAVSLHSKFCKTYDLINDVATGLALASRITKVSGMASTVVMHFKCPNCSHQHVLVWCVKDISFLTKSSTINLPSSPCTFSADFRKVSMVGQPHSKLRNLFGDHVDSARSPKTQKAFYCHSAHVLK